jgi:hypothetical protein
VREVRLEVRWWDCVWRVVGSARRSESERVVICERYAWEDEDDDEGRMSASKSTLKSMHTSEHAAHRLCTCINRTRL